MQALLEKKRVSLGVLLSERVSSSEENVRRREDAVLFWLVPVFYPFSIIPQDYKELYQFNPLAALVLALRTILVEEASPAPSLLIKLAISSITMFVIGFLLFRKLKPKFYDYL